MTGEPAAPTSSRGRWPFVAAVAGGLVIGTGAGLLLLGDDGSGAGDASATTEVTSPPTAELEAALLEAGVPDRLVDCAVGTLGDGGAAAIELAAPDPLAAGSASRAAVEACVLDQLATEVEAGAGIAGTDAVCVATELLDRVGLETALASIDALAVTAEVQQAATDAANTCAADG